VRLTAEDLNGQSKTEFRAKASPFQKVRFGPGKGSGLHSEKVGSGDHHLDRSPSACIHCRARGSVHMNLDRKKMLRANDPHILRYIHTAPRKASDRPEKPVGLSSVVWAYRTKIFLASIRRTRSHFTFEMVFKRAFVG
jgi:hypothetical protein